MGQATTHIEGIMATLIVLGGDNKSIDAETLSVGCFKAFPSLFSMDLFKEYPRIDRFRKIRNSIKYYGGDCDLTDAELALKLAKNVIQKIKNLLKF